MISAGTYDLLGRIVRIRATEPLAGLLADAFEDLAVTDQRADSVLTAKRSRAGIWTVSWPSEERYQGPDDALAFYDVFGAMNEVAALQAAASGMVGMHGAAVRVGDDAAVIVGQSGAGKSTLAARLVQRGDGFIADELSAALAVPDSSREEAASFMVRPYHRPIGIRPAAADVLGLDVPDGPFEHTYPLKASDIGTMAGATPLRLIAFVMRDSAVAPDFEVLSPARALHRLSNLTLGTLGFERETFGRLAELVRSTRAVVLRYGAIDDGVEQLHRALHAVPVD